MDNKEYSIYIFLLDTDIKKLGCRHLDGKYQSPIYT